MRRLLFFITKEPRISLASNSLWPLSLCLKIYLLFRFEFRQFAYSVLESFCPKLKKKYCLKINESGGNLSYSYNVDAMYYTLPFWSYLGPFGSVVIAKNTHLL